METPITASREIVEAIAGAADSAVAVATSAVRSARRRRRGTSKVVWMAVGAVLLAGFALVRARRGSASRCSKATTDDVVGADDSVVSAADRSNGTAPEVELLGVGAQRIRSSIAD